MARRGLELATAYVTLAISADGVGSQVSKSFATVTKAADDAGKRAGQVLAKGINSSPVDLTRLRSEMEKTSRSAVTASKDLEAARHREAQATSLVEQRQRELAAATKKYGDESTTVMQKQRALKDAQFKANIESQKALSAQAAFEQVQGKAATAAEKFAAGEKAAAAAEKDLADKAARANPVLGKLQKTMADFQQSKLKEALGGVNWNGVAKGAGGVAATLTAAFGSSIKTAADFQQEMSGVQAVSGASADQMKQLHDKALQLGKDTAFSASESAKAIEELTKAGVSVPDVMKGAADSTVALAAASGVDMPEAATIASNAMNSFGISADKMSGVVDQISGAANASAIDVKDYGFSLAAAGSVAKTAGMGVNDFSAAVAELGNHGIKGQDAGTSLKTMFLNMVPASAKAAAAMEEYGLLAMNAHDAQKKFAEDGIDLSKVAVRSHGKVKIKAQEVDYSSVSDVMKKLQDYYKKAYNISSSQAAVKASKYMQQSGLEQSAFFDQQTGKMKNLGQIQAQLSKSFGKLGNDQRMSGLQTIFGTDAMRAAAVMTQEGAKGYDKMTSAIKGTTAAQSAAARQQNLKGQIEQMKGSLETVSIEVGERFIPAMTNATKRVTGLINGFLNMPRGEQSVFIGIARAVAVLAGSLALTIKAVQGVQKINESIKVVRGLTAALKGTEIGMKLVRVAQENMFRVGVVGVVLAVVGALVLAYRHSQRFHDVVNAAFRGVVAEGRKLVGWITGTMWPAIRPVFDAIGKAAMGVWTYYIRPGWTLIIGLLRSVLGWITGTMWPAIRGAMQGIAAAARAGAGVFMAVWRAASAAVRTIVGALLPWVRFFVGVFASVWGVLRIILLIPIKLAWLAIKAAWSAITAVFSAAWSFIDSHVLNHWRLFATILGGPLALGVRLIMQHWSTIRSVFSAAWGWLAGVFMAGWRHLSDWLSGPIHIAGRLIAAWWDGIKLEFRVTLAFVRDVVLPFWNTLKDKLSGPVNTAWTLIKDALDKVKGGFSTAVSAISSAWSGIKKAVRDPIVIAVKIGNSLIGGFNKVADLLGITKAPLIPDVPGFRKGGYTGNVGRDTVAGVVHGNEFVMDEETTRLGGGPKGMERIRSALRRGGVPTDIFDVVRRGPKGPAGQGGPTEDAISRGYALANDGENWHERCLNFVNRAWGASVPRLMVATAKQAALGGPVNMQDVPPPGAAVFANTSANGHAMLSIGGGQVLSTDWGGRGKVGIGAVGEILSTWHAPYMGWWHPLLGTGQSGSRWGILGRAAGGVKNAGKWVAGKAESGVDWMGNKALWVGHETVKGAKWVGNEIISKLNPLKVLADKLSGEVKGKLNGNFVGKLVGAMPMKMINAVKDKVTSAISSSDSGAVSADNGATGDPGGAGVQRWRSTIAQALSMNGLPTTDAYVNAWLRQVQTESGGNPTISQQIHDVNSGGNEAQGLLQVIPPTFRANAFPGHGNIHNGLDNALAAIHYAKQRYGAAGMLSAIGQGHGYETGTLAATSGLHMVAEHGPELITSPTLTRFRGGERVYNNRDTARLLEGGFPAPAGLRIVEGTLSIDADGHAFIRGVAEDVVLDYADATARRGH